MMIGETVRNSLPAGRQPVGRVIRCSLFYIKYRIANFGCSCTCLREAACVTALPLAHPVCQAQKEHKIIY